MIELFLTCRPCVCWTFPPQHSGQQGSLSSLEPERKNGGSRRLIRDGTSNGKNTATFVLCSTLSLRSSIPNSLVQGSRPFYAGAIQLKFGQPYSAQSWSRMCSASLSFLPAGWLRYHQSSTIWRSNVPLDARSLKHNPGELGRYHPARVLQSVSRVNYIDWKTNEITSNNQFESHQRSNYTSDAVDCNHQREAINNSIA